MNDVHKIKAIKEEQEAKKSTNLKNGKIKKKRIMFTEEDIMELSQIRIIQKNLVHFQGFPESLYNADLLKSKPYFGQYGKIKKIVLVSKKCQENKKMAYNAYITYEKKEEAALAILAVDSTMVKDKLTRVFFGTTKYCSHFLKNKRCQNKANCMFIHELVNQEQIFGNNLNFGYEEHLKLAKILLDFNSPLTKSKILNTQVDYYSVLPSPKIIYLKEDLKNIEYTMDDVIKQSKNNYQAVPVGSNKKFIYSNNDEYYSENINEKDFRNGSDKIMSSYNKAHKNGSISSSSSSSQSNYFPEKRQNAKIIDQNSNKFNKEINNINMIINNFNNYEYYKCGNNNNEDYQRIISNSTRTLANKELSLLSQLNSLNINFNNSNVVNYNYINIYENNNDKFNNNYNIINNNKFKDNNVDNNLNIQCNINNINSFNDSNNILKSNNINKENIFNSEMYSDLINQLLKRKPFFMKYKSKIPLKDIEIMFCLKNENYKTILTQILQEFNELL